MSVSLNDIVRFRGDRLFDGAINVDWFYKDPKKCQAAAESFVFHGPTYHGVSQEEIEISHGHRLIDTANFIRSVVRCCKGIEDKPFSLAIAGYGTGKSHLALTIAWLLSNPDSEAAQIILKNIESADPLIGGEIRAILDEVREPSLILTINGMGNFDLAAEFTSQIMHQLRKYNVNTQALDELRPRFRHAIGLVNISNKEDVHELTDKCGLSSKDELILRLQEHNEIVYSTVHKFFEDKGLPIKAIGDETVKDVIDTTCREYCGEGKPFRNILILFDEFGRYAEFATERSHIAGNGVLQHLFEGIQENSSYVTFIGFIQFELNAYVERIAPELKNDLLKVTSRYQSADKVYLSINLETLIANLIEKVDEDKIDSFINTEDEILHSATIADRVRQWFPLSCNHQLWKDDAKFHTVIRKGCWHLSPFSVWFLFHLAAAGKYLQQRSVLALLINVFQQYGEKRVEDPKTWELVPVDLWSDDLEEDLRLSEEKETLGSVTISYATVISKYGHQLPKECIKILQAIVLSSIMKMMVSGRDDAVSALALLSNLTPSRAIKAIQQLESEYNVLAWDSGTRRFDILGDAASRSQFLATLRQRVASTYDERGKANLFVRKAADWCELLGDQSCDFAETHGITTQEWKFFSVRSNFEMLNTCVLDAAHRWKEALSVDTPRGTIIYCYIEPSRNPESVKNDVAALLCNASKAFQVEALPILIVLLFDDGKLGQALAELAILEEGFTEQDKLQFGNLIRAHHEKTHQTVVVEIESLIKGRHYISSFREKIESRRLGQVCNEIFHRIYPQVLSFPFDGFSTAKGNAADTCQRLITELLRGMLDYDAVISKPQKDKNRALRTLKETWQVFVPTTGKIKRSPSHSVVRSIIADWERQLSPENGNLPIAHAIKAICAPPYGANIASAGLLFGVFVAPRINDLIILQDGKPIDIVRLLEDGIFRSKNLDLSKLENTILVKSGSAGSEWDKLLDEWEQARNYHERVDFLARANELGKRIPVPSVLKYKYDHLVNLSEEALIKIEFADKRMNDGLEKIEKGHSKQDVNLLSWGGSDLKKLQADMHAESFWRDESIHELDNPIEIARQSIIQFFPRWIKMQLPINDMPATVGNFQHHMLKVIGSNLKRLQLTNELEQLEQHVSQVVEKADTVAEARQLMRDVSSFIDQHSDIDRIIRVAKIRGLKDKAKGYAAKLIEMNKRINLPELISCRTRLSEFSGMLKDVENSATEKAQKLWNTTLSKDNLKNLLIDIEELERIFEGCESDIDDLRMMRHVLQIYDDCYRQMCRETLTWEELEVLKNQLTIRTKSELDELEPPWPPDEVIDMLAEEVRKQRLEKGNAWMNEIMSACEGLDKMDASKANSLRAKAMTQPPFLDNEQRKVLMTVVNQVEQHLMNLEIDWLVERYLQLAETAQKDFLKRIGIRMAGNTA